MNLEEEINNDELLIAPTPEIVQYLLDCDDISIEEYNKYQMDPDNYTPKLNTNYGE